MLNFLEFLILILSLMNYVLWMMQFSRACILLFFALTFLTALYLTGFSCVPTAVGLSNALAASLALCSVSELLFWS